VTLAYDEAAAGPKTRARLQGFGFLVSRSDTLQDVDTAHSEGKRMLACTFVQNKFSGRVPAGKLLFRCFISAGAAADPADETMQRSDEELVTGIREELRSVLRFGATPLFTRVFRWRQAMAQYEVGHLERVARIDALVAGVTGLALAGNAYRGIGVPDCVREGSLAAERLLAAIPDS
jgi:oxygen-dependent protoporphyrinogen oxidase